MRISLYLMLAMVIPWTSVQGTIQASLEGVHIQFKPTAEVSGPEIELFELADVMGDDSQLIELLNQFKISSAPLPGAIRRVHLSTIIAQLKNASLLPNYVKFNGPDSIIVSTKGRLVEGEELILLAQNYIMEQMIWKPEEVTFEYDRLPPEIVVPEGNYNYTISPISNTFFRGTVQLDIALHVNHKVFQRVPVVLTVRVFKEVVIANRQIFRGELFDEKDLIIRKREVTRYAGNFITEKSAVIGKRATQYISQNQIIVERMIAKPPVIQRAKEVTIVLNKPGMQLTTKGVALENGFEGETIRVKNINSNKTINAKVIDATTVVVNVEGK